MRIQCGIAIVSVAFSALLLSGCGPKQPWETAGVSEDFYQVTEDFAPRYLELDQDGYRYDQALEAVDAYLAGETGQDEAVSALEETIQYFETELDGWETVSLDETLTKHLQAVDISPVEYEMCINEADQTSRENLSWSLSKDQKIQDSTRGYYYYGCLNYWFPGANEKEREYLDIKVIDQLHSYIPEDPVWCSTREEAEEQVMRYLDAEEDILNQFADHVGQQQNDLYKMEQELAALLEGLLEESGEVPAAE